MHDEDATEYWCTECRKSCDTLAVDEGFGATEYWGATSIHEQWVEVSLCCEAEVTTDNLNEGEEV